MLDRGGEGTLVIEAYDSYLAPRRAGRVRVAVTYTTPGSTETATRTRSLRLSQKRARPRAHSEPRVHDLRAVRHGDRIDVTWRADARVMPFFEVLGTRTRSRYELPADETDLADNGRMRRFSATLPAAGVRYITLISSSAGPVKLVTRVRMHR